MKNLLEFTGIEPERIRFSWISSAEATKFVEVVNDVTAAVKPLGPNKTFLKTDVKVA